MAVRSGRSCVRGGVRQALDGQGHVVRCAERHDKAVHAALGVVFLAIP